MPCYFPLDAWQSQPGAKPVFKLKRSLRAGFTFLQLPCGQCIGCRLERSRQWAMRCVHEASLWENNCFLTLTYSDANLPSDGSLNKRHWQLFMKKLRKRFSGSTIRFYMCGEYGDSFSNPHFHACIFGFDFPDKELFSTKHGVNLSRSSILESLWPYGFSTIGDVNFESAAYVARYVLKKVGGKLSDSHYQAVLGSTGEIVHLMPEFTLMSRRPGIASGWWHKYHSDTDKDFLTMRGVKMRPPKFYDRLLHQHYPEVLNEHKLTRKSKALLSVDNSPDRLAVRHELAQLRSSKLKRGIE